MSAPPRPGGPGRGFPLRIGTVLKRTGRMWAYDYSKIISSWPAS